MDVRDRRRGQHLRAGRESRVPPRREDRPSAWQSTGTPGWRAASGRRSACQPGRAPRLTISRRSRGECEHRVGLLAAQPAVVVLAEVVREADQRVAVSTSAAAARRRRGGGRCRARCSRGRRRGAAARDAPRARGARGDVVDVVGVVVDRGADDCSLLDAVAGPSRRAAARRCRGWPRRGPAGGRASAARRGSGSRGSRPRPHRARSWPSRASYVPRSPGRHSRRLATETLLVYGCFVGQRTRFARNQTPRSRRLER